MLYGEALPDTYGQMPDEVFFGVLNGAGNLEAKIALALLIYTDPISSHDSKELAQMFNQAQGTTPAWRLKTSSAGEYCSHSFEPLGIATGPDADALAEGKTVARWQAGGDHQEQVLAMLGFLADWSLGHPELSPRILLGSTTSPTGARSPHARYLIYQTLLKGESDQSLTEIAHSVGDVYSSSPLQAVNGQVTSLETSGILQKLSNRKGDDPLILIADPDYHGHHRALEATRPATRALYQITAQLGAGEKIHLNDLMDRVLALDPTVDTVAFRSMLRLNIDQQIGYPGLQWADRKHVGLDEQTAVAFVPEAADAIGELIDGLERIKRGESVQTWTTRAKEIVSDPDDFRALVAQGRESSARANTPGREALAEELLSIIRRLGSVTIRAAQRELRPTLRLTLGGTYELLASLVEAGILTGQKVRTERHSGITSSEYRVAEDKRQ